VREGTICEGQATVSDNREKVHDTSQSELCGVDSQPAHRVIVAEPVRFGTLTLIEQHPPWPNRRG